MNNQADSRKLLVDMLHEAAELEHCLLNTYLFSAASLKSTPQEFAEISGIKNRRRAQQFERARLWKAGVFMIAAEEMRHLHYVQCLIRALGERPYLGLPRRNAQGIWNIPNWRVEIGGVEAGPDGTDVPILPFGTEALRNFILYESTDSLQDEDPFGAESLALYQRLYDFELDLRIEGMLVDMPATSEIEKKRKATLGSKLRELYTQVTPVEKAAAKSFAATELAGALPPLEQLRFQSIAEFYRNGILPLYETAFEKGWVVATDRNLVDELADPNYALEGALPVGPIGRDARFTHTAKANFRDPIRDYKRVDQIIDEIVDEGEGATQFRQRAEAMLAKVAEIGVGGYLNALAIDRAKRAPTPDWLQEAQLVRNSHLYLFAMMFVEHEQEQNLAKQSGVEFIAARAPVASPSVALRKIGTQLPAQFNAAYAALLAWLARIYETRHWASDQPRRKAIEMLATWPLMSLSIRPMLELASFFDIDRESLFRFESEDLPMLPIWAQQLVQLYNSEERSEAINAEMDWLVVRTLKGVAEWAQSQLPAVAAAGLGVEGEMIRRRLIGIAKLGEFERQFPFREAGGYSNRPPSITYQTTHSNEGDLAETPDPTPLFADSLVLRVRFAGRGLVLLATDPDPPLDEVGVTGTHMFHPADGEHFFDRAQVWQDFEPGKNIHRSAPGLGPLGINCREIALLAPELNSGASAGYVPLQVMSSQGAVQASGVQQKMEVQGLSSVAQLKPDDLGLGTLRMFLENKGGIRPYGVGENHLVWQDGEPIDPFILSLHADSGKGAPSPLLSREIFNRGKTIMEMAPYERLLTGRGPVGFDDVSNIPPWALTDEIKAIINVPGFPVGFLKQRSKALAGVLYDLADVTSWTRESVDEAVSMAERLVRVAQPRGTTINWLPPLLRYGHTLSGEAHPGDPDKLLEAIGRATKLSLSMLQPDPDRSSPNSRWLVDYTEGVMDTDTLSYFVFGELYVPIAAAAGPNSFSRSWRFPAAVAAAVQGYACQFQKPFWASFKVKGDTRTIQVAGLDPADPNKSVTFTETLTEASASGYRYAMTGYPGILNYRGSFEASVAGDWATLTWSCSFDADDAVTAMRCLSLLAGSADTMGVALSQHFSPDGASN